MDERILEKHVGTCGKDSLRDPDIHTIQTRQNSCGNANSLSGRVEIPGRPASPKPPQHQPDLKRTVVSDDDEDTVLPTYQAPCAPLETLTGVHVS